MVPTCGFFFDAAFLTVLVTLRLRVTGATHTISRKLYVAKATYTSATDLGG
jgi:hypothetical protein